MQPLAAHIEGHLVVATVYLIWAVLGRWMTGEYVYLYLDPDHAGWRALVCHDLALLSFTMTAFSIQWGLHGFQEELAWKAECDQLGR